MGLDDLESRICNMTRRAERHSLTLAEYVILHHIYLEENPLNQVVYYATSLWNKGMGYPLEPQSSYEQALEALLIRRIVQVVDESVIAEIERLLEAQPAIGPTEGLPKLRTVHFTPSGADLWRELAADSERGSCLTGVVAWIASGTQCTVYSDCVDTALRCATRELNAVKVSTPRPIGPWRRWWWHTFPSGFSVECTVRPENAQEDTR